MSIIVILIFRTLVIKRRQNADKIGGILIMKSAVILMYKPFDNRITKRISTPISETFLCENVTATYTA